MNMNAIFIAYVFMLLDVINICSCNELPTISPSATEPFIASLKGTDETPSNYSPATGTAIFSYNFTTFILTGTITFSGIASPITGAYIYKGTIGNTGDTIFAIVASGPFTSPISYTSPALDSLQRIDLIAGNYYVNIHSTAYPNGEIRGQLIEQSGIGN